MTKITHNQALASLKAKLDASRTVGLTLVAPPVLQPRTSALFLQIGSKLYPVADYAQASDMFCKARDTFGEGASNTPSPHIIDENGKIVAHVSYNGRVWAGDRYVAGAKPLCEASR